jgi:hypothetical protein
VDAKRDVARLARFCSSRTHGKDWDKKGTP